MLEDAIPQGCSYWRMNASLLKNDNVKANLRNCILDAYPVLMCTADPYTAWLHLKTTLKGRLQHFAALRAKEQVCTAKDLKKGVLFANWLLRRRQNMHPLDPTAVQEAQQLVLMHTNALSNLTQSKHNAATQYN
jgi:hypothetical protein